MENIISFSDVSYKDLFNNLTINIEKNKFLSISGANNCGKTTLIRILNKEINLNQNIIVKDKKINEYKTEEYSKIVQCILPEEILFIENTLEEELYLQSNGNNQLIDYITKGLKIKNIEEKDVEQFSQKEIVLAQIALAIANKPQIILIDDISSIFTRKERKSIFNFLIDYKKKNELTIIYTTIDLEDSLLTDYLYILDEGKVALEGDPITVLEKDNIINKIGLDIPFMIDLSVKLRDYDLVDKIELDMDRMIEKLWN